MDGLAEFKTQITKLAKTEIQNFSLILTEDNVGYLENIRKHAGKLTRLELIFSQALEEDFVAEFKEKKLAARYTKIANVMGAGYSNPRLGDAIWPQLNIMYIIYCSEEEAQKIIEICQSLREKYISEGIACFKSTSEEV